MTTLIIDNYDSFTFNLYQLVGEISGAEPIVVRNDQLAFEELKELPFDCAIISPGPGRPEPERDFGLSRRVILDLDAPVLGVCLGHQGICHAFGGVIRHAPEPMHGRLSRVYHEGRDLFAGMPNPFWAVRYHSLLCADPLPLCLAKTAWTGDGIVMGLRHRSRPLWGVQFHPESVCTQDGRVLLQNFLDLAARYGRSHAQPPHARSRVHRPVPQASKAGGPFSGQQLFVRRVKQNVDAASLFGSLFAREEVAVWLDSSRRCGGARFSVLAAAREGAEIVRYDAWNRQLTVCREGRTETSEEDLFDYLRRTLATLRVDSPPLPFEFHCGYIGYFGYEMKAACGAQARHRSSLPDSLLLFADRSVVIDHAEDTVYLLYLGRAEDASQAEAWFDHVCGHFGASPPLTLPLFCDPPRFETSQSRARYIEQIRVCQEHIRNGESYEICLTNRLSAASAIDPLHYYQLLRVRNPAPYAAYLRFPEVAVACSSPERFLKVSRLGVVETKPIKGTVRRGADPAEDRRLRKFLEHDPKNRAENLMIVDLLRNDLGRVCRPGAVVVSKLMHVESYATVHQLVSTIRGRLQPDRTAVDCLRAAFPGGSMTGAPKLRTMEIIDNLEESARGVYSGSIGYLSLNGAADLNIVIRTAVFAAGRVNIGIGGAIVALSDPAAEWDETMLKGQALLDAFAALCQKANVAMR